MSQPLVSIIIPCYNAEKYVGEAIESALAQTYPNVEVIVIDDGSTDGSLDVIRSFGERIRWESGPNRGGCAARNRGIELAQGEFIQFLDADDLLHQDKLARQVPLAIERPMEIVRSRWDSEVKEPGGEHLFCASLTGTDPVILALQKIIGTLGPLYPRLLLDRIGGWRAELPCAQDYDLNLRLACAGATFHDVPESLATTRRLPRSVSNNSVRVLDQFEDICWRAYCYLRDRGELTDGRAAAFAAAFATHARAYLRLGMAEKASARFQEAAKMHPSGGLQGAYQPSTLMLRRILGAGATERVVQFKRYLTGRMG